MEKVIERFASLLDTLDTFLATRNSRERLMLYLLPLLLFGFLSYTYLIPPLEAEETKISRQLHSIKSEITTYEDLLSSKTRSSRYLEKLDEENQQLKSAITKTKDLTLYTESKLQQLKFVHFDAFNWSDFLHQLVTYSTQHHISMSAFSNNRLETPEANGRFTKVLSVDFNATGEFYNMLGFIRSIENDRAVTNIEQLALKARNGRIEADFSITLWGVLE